MNPMKHGLRWGLISGATLVGLGIVFNLTGAYKVSALGLLFLIIPLVFLFLAMRGFREANGSRSYGQGLAIAVPVIFVGALLYAAFVFGWNSFVSDEVIQFSRATADEQAAASGASASELEQQGKLFDAIFTPMGFAVITVVQSAFIGGIGALIVAAIGRKATGD